MICPYPALFRSHGDMPAITRFDGRKFTKLPAPVIYNRFDSADGENGWTDDQYGLRHLQDGKWQFFPEITNGPQGLDYFLLRYFRALDLGDSRLAEPVRTPHRDALTARNRVENLLLVLGQALAITPVDAVMRETHRVVVVPGHPGLDPRGALLQLPQVAEPLKRCLYQQGRCGQVPPPGRRCRSQECRVG